MSCDESDSNTEQSSATDAVNLRKEHSKWQHGWLSIVAIVVSVLALAFSIFAYFDGQKFQTGFKNEESYRVQANPDLHVIEDDIQITDGNADGVRRIRGLGLDIYSPLGGIFQMQILPIFVESDSFAVESVQGTYEIDPKDPKSIGAGGLRYTFDLPEIKLSGSISSNGNVGESANYDCFAVRLEDFTGHSTLSGVIIYAPVGDDHGSELAITVMDDVFLAKALFPPSSAEVPLTQSDYLDIEIGKAYLQLRQTLIDNGVISK